MKRTPTDTLVVAIDLERHPERLVDTAVALAAQAATRKCHFLVPVGSADAILEAMARLSILVKNSARNLKDCAFFGHARSDDPAEAILHLAVESRADAIVLDADAEGAWPHVRAHVHKATPCSVLLVRDPSYADETGSLVPHILACHECEAVRAESQGEAWWCPEHARLRTHVMRRLV